MIQSSEQTVVSYVALKGIWPDRWAIIKFAENKGT